LVNPFFGAEIITLSTCAKNRISKQFSDLIFTDMLGDCRKSPKMAISAISH
jgi:hypothetical protein